MAKVAVLRPKKTAVAPEVSSRIAPPPEPTPEAPRVKAKPPRPVHHVSRETFVHPVEPTAGAVSFSVYHEEGGPPERCSWWTANGVEVSTFPVRDFTVELITERWGGGKYSVRFVDRKGHACGRKVFRLTGAPKDASHQAIPVDPTTSPTSIMRSDPMTAFTLVKAIKDMANEEATKQITLQAQFLKDSMANNERMFALAMGRDRELAAQRAADAARALPPEVSELITSLRNEVAALRAELEDDGGDDPDPGEEDPPRASDGGLPAYPDQWDGFDKLLYRFVVRAGLPVLESQVKAIAPELLAKFAAEVQARAEAAAAARTVITTGGTT
jgi:hypothetical protein